MVQVFRSLQLIVSAVPTIFFAGRVRTLLSPCGLTTHFYIFSVACFLFGASRRVVRLSSRPLVVAVAAAEHAASRGLAPVPVVHHALCAKCLCYASAVPDAEVDQYASIIRLSLRTANSVSAKFCNGGHVCSPPKECCTLGCCYVYSHPSTPVAEMFAFLIWTYWYLWAAILAGLALAAACGCWLWHRRRGGTSEDGSTSDRASSGSFYPPPHYSRCSSFIQALPPPYNEVTAKPDLYPLVIGYDEGMGKGTSGFVMRYFRTLSHASTLDSLSSSFMCNVVNEANTIIPPPYSCNNSLDELSTMGCERGENADGGSIVSLANNRTASDISSLAAQSPCSPPRATSPTIELRELLDKIHQLPQVPSEHNFATSAHHQNRPQVLQPLSENSPSQQRPVSPGEFAFSRARRTRGKMYMPLGLPSARNKPKRWLSRSAPTTPSGTIPMSLFPGQSRRPSETNENYGQQFVPLLAEQDETDINTLAHCGRGSSLPEHEEETQQL